jgi:aryl-alcohol dehydrogenase-like predicted oxidoreductase
VATASWIVPIPGTRRVERLDENLGAAAIELTPDDLGEAGMLMARFLRTAAEA